MTGGGTITHHHAVGRDHAPWMSREIGEQGVAALRALKAELDPAGIMNPGKLLLAQLLTVKGPRRTTWPGCVGLRSGLARDQHFAEVLPALLGSSAAAGQAVARAHRRAAAERQRAGVRVVQPDRVEEAFGARQVLRLR